MTSKNYIALFRLDGSPDERAENRLAQGKSLSSLLLSATNAPTRLTLLVGVDELREMKLHREGDDYSPPYDFAVKLTLANASTLLESVKDSGLPARCSDWSVYEVDESVKKESSEPWKEGVLPGVHMLHPLYFHDDLPLPVLLRSWKEIHGDLALRVHVGADMYRQHLVQNIPVHGKNADFGGFSEFHFPSKDALMEGYFDSERGRMEIRHDIRHFIKGFPARLFAEEHRLGG